MNRPLWINRARGVKPGWTATEQHVSAFRWAGIEPAEADALDRLAARVRNLAAFVRAVWFAAMVALTVGGLAMTGLHLWRALA